MGPVWRLIKGQKDMCHRCGKEIVDFPAVGRVVNYQFLAEEKYCWDCYRYLTPFVDEVAWWLDQTSTLGPNPNASNHGYQLSRRLGSGRSSS